MTRRRTALPLIVLGSFGIVGAVIATSRSIDEAATATDVADREDVDVAGTIRQLPVDAAFDYQIGGDDPTVTGIEVVSRDWSAGSPLEGGYSICYVNAFQTQPDDDGSRPDERSNWPSDLILTGFEDDPNWEGEYLVDIGSATSRTAAADHIDQMIGTCADKGFDAVEFDNLDAWTRLDGLPFDRADTIEFATTITRRAHGLGLAVAQKNTTELLEERDRIGFDLAVVEECGRFDECSDFTDAYDDRVVAIEYTDAGFETACADVGRSISVVRRDVAVSRSGSDGYVRDEC